MTNPFPELDTDVEHVAVGRRDVERLLAKMARDLGTAQRNREDAPDWALTIAHQAIYLGCVALMAVHGCRPRVNGHHMTALRFARLALPVHSALLHRAERLRRHRHRAMYGTADQVSQTDLDSALELAHQLTAILREAVLQALAAQEQTQEGPPEQGL